MKKAKKTCKNNIFTSFYLILKENNYDFTSIKNSLF